MTVAALPCCLLILAAAIPVMAQQPPGNPEMVQAGKKQFEAHCAGCHGADGAGGEHGPDIVDTPHPRIRSAEGLQEIIHSGIPDAGMPAFQLPDRDLQQLVAFVHSLTAPAMNGPMEGDAAAGEKFFFGKGNCSSCHMVQGRGGFIGPDLTSVGRERRLGQIERKLRNPSLQITSGFQVVSVRLHDGRMVRGIAKNESNYDLQLQTPEGRLLFLRRGEIASESREQKSLMPSVDASENEMQNLLAYLSRLSGLKETVSTPADKAAGGVSFADLADPNPGEWPTYHGRFSGNRHSALKQIHAGNVATLGPKWLFPIPNSRHLEVTPVVANGVMYVTTANEAYALDPGSGRQIWHYGRPLTKGLVGDAAGAINRGVALLGDRVFMVTDNAHLIALHRSNGQLLWDIEMADSRKHYGATSAPLAINDLVISGTSGGDEGARGFIDAYKASSGERAWRFWTMPAPGEPLSETWAGRALEHGCSTAWLTGTYDPGSNLLYWTTGNPCPDYNGDERKGDNLYSCSVIALKADTGKLVWYYQYTPHDLHDWDSVQVPMLIDADFRGRPRKLLAQGNRNGFFYLLDRTDGKLLLAEPFVHKLTWATGIGADGRPRVTPESEPTPEGVKVCPAVSGATNWMSTAYNPDTGLFYLQAMEKCEIYTKSSAWWEPGKSFYGGGNRAIPGEPGQKILRALDLRIGKSVWEYPQIGQSVTWGGVLSTAGGLVFFGEDSGAFTALDAKTGKELWYFQTNQVWKASPMTYLAKGKQYVAVAAGSNIISFALP
jgi:alcohol dehydrogenase (cytochrome c)